MLQGVSERETPENLVSLVFDQSQGNPFFVEELYRHLLEEGKLFDAAGQFRTDPNVEQIDVPENVRLIIGRRLERFHENENRVPPPAPLLAPRLRFQLPPSTSHIQTTH